MIELCGFIESVSRKGDNWLWISVDNFTQERKLPRVHPPGPFGLGELCHPAIVLHERPDRQGGVLGARRAQVVRACRHRVEGT
jgi:hypothetical protein